MPYTPNDWITDDPIKLSDLVRIETGVDEVTQTFDSAEPYNKTIPGQVLAYGGGSAPAGWLLCDGSEVSRTTFADLFAIIGTTYGEGDESTTFNLPSLLGRVAAGYKAADADFGTLGGAGGALTHILTEAELPAHTHDGTLHTHYLNHTHGLYDATTNAELKTYPTWGSAPYQRVLNGGSGGIHYTGDASTTIGAATATNSSTGGGLAHANVQPYIVLNYIIKT